MADKTTITVDDIVGSYARAVEQVARSAFSGKVGRPSAGKKGTRLSKQYKFKVDGKKKSSLAEAARAKIMKKAFKTKRGELETMIKNAMTRVIVGMTGASGGGQSISVGGQTVFNAKPARPLENEPFAQFVTSKEGAGVLGLPDPENEIDKLKVALAKAINVNVKVGPTGPTIKFEFNMNRLLALTPHPAAGSVPLKSWLSLITGPDFLSGGTPGYEFVTVSEMEDKMREASETGRQSRGAARYKSMGRIRGLHRLAESPRTLGYAKEFAGLMFKTRRSADKALSPAEYAGGDGRDYSPDTAFKGYWPMWWNKFKADLELASRRVMRRAIIVALRG